jgi:hypothetical protein
MKHRILLTQITLCLCFFLSPFTGRAETTQSVNKEALTILKTMSDYLLSQETVSFHAVENEDEVLDNGQKIMTSREIHFELLRPNKFHVKRQDAEGEVEMFYNGSSFTLFRKNENLFATVAAPPTVGKVFVELANKLDINITARDLLGDDSYTLLLASVSSGFVVGDDLVDSIICTQLAFRSAETDMQIWITKGAIPLPKKYVITSRWIIGAPQYEVSFFDWNVQDTIDTGTFTFKAPQGALEIPFAETTAEQEAN